MLAFVPPPAAALGYGEPVVSSALGQPLRMRIPMHVDPDLDLSSQCIRLLGNAGSDAIPTLSMAMARITIERKGEERILRIDSLYPVNEPVLRVSVEAGCAQHTRRDFMLLLDPPDTLPQLALTIPKADGAAAVPHISAGGVPTPLPDAGPGPDAAAPVGAAAVPAGSEADSPAGGAPEIELGIASIAGRIGEPLSMQVPVTGSGAATLDPGCVHLAGAWSGEGAPVLSQARLDVVHSGGDTRIDVQTSNPITEPALRVILEAGCGMAARREYAVLLDKPQLKAEAAVAESAPERPAAASLSSGATAAASPVASAEVVPTLPPAAASTPKPPPKPPAPRRILPPAAPVQITAAPAQVPVAKAPAAPAPAKPAPRPAPAKPKPAPVADRLVLAAPPEQPDPAALRMAEMDKRIADLTKEVTELRTQLVTERQKAADAAAAAQAQQQRLGTGWIVAILALLALGVAGLLTWKRKRNALPWEKPGWEPDANTIVAAPANIGTAAQAGARPAAVAAGAAAQAGTTPTPALRPNPAEPLPVLSRGGAAPIPPLASFQELAGGNTTISQAPLGRPTNIEVTELQDGDPELEKMHTVFMDPGSLEYIPEPVGANPGTRTPAPRAEIPEHAIAGRSTSHPVTAAPVPAATQLPAIASPTVVAPDQRHGAFTFDEGPFTQTPTMLVLDLDLTTRTVPPEEVEAAKAAAKAKAAADGKAG